MCVFCQTSCQFNRYKNGQLADRLITVYSNQLQMGTLSASDSGNYSCQFLNEHTSTESNVATLIVKGMFKLHYPSKSNMQTFILMKAG